MASSKILKSSNQPENWYRDEVRYGDYETKGFQSVWQPVKGVKGVISVSAYRSTFTLTA